MNVVYLEVARTRWPNGMKSPGIVPCPPSPLSVLPIGLFPGWALFSLPRAKGFRDKPDLHTEVLSKFIGITLVGSGSLLF
jgi:hypothetical protein